jgi:outer membrane protein assembly factor BamB
LDLTDFGFINIPVGKFILDERNFAFPGFNGSYDAYGQLITGILTIFGTEIIVEFFRIETKPEFNFDYPEKEVTWTFETNSPIWSPLSVSEGHLIFGNDAGNLYSINMDDLETSWIFNSESKIRSKALAKNGFVYFTSDDGYLYSIHFGNGKLNWKAYIGNDAIPRNLPAIEGSTYDYMCSSPVIEKGTIYVGSIDSSLYAINNANGKINWKYKTGDIIRSTPIVDSGIVYIGSWDHNMYAINVKNGAMIWKYDAGERIQSTPVIIDNKLVFGSRSAFIFGIDKNTGDELWKTSYWGSWVESSPVIFDGKIYIGSSDFRKVHAIDPENGKVIWSTRVEAWTWTTPAINEEYLFIGSAGTMQRTDIMHTSFYGINRQTGNIAWQVRAAEKADVFIYGFASSPVIWNNWVLFGGLDGKIYGIKNN